MEELTTVDGTVHSIIFQNAENGYTVLRLLTAEGEVVTVVGCIPCVAPGEHLTVDGVWETHPQHGEQLRAVELERSLPVDEEEIVSLWDHGDVHLERLFNRDHDNGDEFNTWLQVAVYMTKERPEYGKDVTPNGAQIYSCSRNLVPPVELPTVWVEEAGPLVIPDGAIAIESETKVNEFGRFSYVKYMTAPLRDPAE